MKLPLSWLKDYVNMTLPPEELAERLTLAGMEVGSMERVGGWESIFVGEVTALSRHPNADRLLLATISLGQESHTVVCGAPNIAVGQKVAFARVGAELMDGHTGQRLKLQKAKIRGVVSEGMACSEKELGISDSHEGIMVLPADAPVGTPLDDYLGDVIFDLKVTPNRPDCLSALGVAREIAALTDQVIHYPPLEYEEAGPPIEGEVSIEIPTPDLCPRYCGGLITGIKVAPSPLWLQNRLTAAGMRPINNIVDITNYVMLEFGQPLHAFDFHTLRGRKIIVRRARQGETMMSLDGVERALDTEILVIADAERAVAIAGIMGGQETEVTQGTTAILLESANFSAANNHRTSLQLRLRSEASIRFEKGLNPELASRALRRAVALTLELAGGQAARGILDVYPGKKEARPITLRMTEVERLLGLRVEKERIQKVLTSLGFDCQTGADEILVGVPYWRSDVRLPADLVEEVARIVGYGDIPTTSLRGEVPSQEPDALLELREGLRDLAVDCGLQEIITYSLTSQEKLERLAAPLPAVHLANPLSTEQEYLRTSLLPGLLQALAHNQKYEDRGIRLFELGRIYLPRANDLPAEREVLGIALSGPSAPLSWLEKDGLLGFYDIKGVVEGLLGRLGLRAQFKPEEDPALHPARQAGIFVQDKKVGWLGEVHPRVAETFSLAYPTCVAEIGVEALLAFTTTPRHFQSLPRFPGSLRDLALVVDIATPAQKIEEIIASSPLVSRVELFDVYTGPPIPPGKRSLAYRVIYQSPDHTLTDQEVDRAQEEILARLQKELGASLRA